MKNASFRTRLAIGSIIALILDLLIFILADSQNATWEVGQPNPITIATVAISSIVPLLLGGFVFDVLAKRNSSWGNRLSTGGFVFAILTAPSGYLSSKDLPTGLALASMHVVVGLVWYLTTKKEK